MSNLLQCPCCGGEAVNEDHRLCWYVRCQSCGLGVMGDRVPELEDGDEEKIDWQAVELSAVDAWNRRTDPPGWQLVPVEPDEAMVDACRQMMMPEFTKTFDKARQWCEMAGAPVACWPEYATGEDHIPKAARADISYRMMLSAAPRFGDDQ